MNHAEAISHDLAEDTTAFKFLTFVLGDECYGIEIRNVTEIIGMQRITPVPDVPHYVRGVINLRGKVIPVTDIRLRFGMMDREYDNRTCIIVVHVRGQEVGMIVDTVQEVADIPEASIQSPDELGDLANAAYLAGMAKIEDEVKVLLDCEQLLFC